MQGNMGTAEKRHCRRSCGKSSPLAGMKTPTLKTAKRLEARASRLTDSGLPRFPVFHAVRNYE